MSEYGGTCYVHSNDRSMVQAEIQYEICKAIDDFIETCRAKGMSSHFISGLEISKGFVNNPYTYLKNNPEIAQGQLGFTVE